MGHGRDAEAVSRGDAALGAQQGQRAEGRVDGGGAEGPGELPEPVGQQRLEVDHLLHLVLVRSDFAALVGRPDPHAEQLGDLLLEGHLGDEGVGARLVAEGRVAPQGKGVVESVVTATLWVTFLPRP